MTITSGLKANSDAVDALDQGASADWLIAESRDFAMRRIKSLIAMGFTSGLALALQVAAVAQQEPIKYRDGPVWGLHALPGDVLPPFGIPDANNKLPPYPQRPPNFNPMLEHPFTKENPESKAEGPPLGIALAGVQAALSDCERRNTLGTAVVVDIAGDIRVALAVDGTDGSHLFVAARKALTALEFGRPSVDVANDAKKGDPAVLSRINPAMFVQLGAYPLRAKGKVIGAIGYSGGADVLCAKVGADYINARLAK